MFRWRKKEKADLIFPPVEGPVLELADVPDPVFSSGTVGEGFAVSPDSGEFCSPADGVLVLVAGTGHAYAVKTPIGAEILVHIGVDTLKLGGRGFTPLKEAGAEVTAGEPIIRCDLETVTAQVPSMVTSVVVTNSKGIAIERIAGSEAVARLSLRP